MSNQISNNAINGKWNEKNNHDQIVLKNSWTKNNFATESKTLNADIAINKYRTGQTIPNTKPGGFKSDLIRDWYHKSSPVFDDDRPPRIRASKTKKNTLDFLFSNLSASKESTYSFCNIAKKVRAFWPCFNENIKTYKDQWNYKNQNRVVLTHN